MPVVKIAIPRFKKFLPDLSESKILDMLPFAGLDIEGEDEGIIRVEYNPNRPDYSSDYGIFRALRGLLGIELGLPKYKQRSTKYSIMVDSQTKTLRPHIVALVATGGRLDDQTIKQMVAMQEDLHEGIGRRRKKASIGLHNLDAVEFPIRYTIADGGYSFVPLGESSPKTIREILDSTATGRQYGHLLGASEKYPIIKDESGSVLSLPPIVNGNMTRVDEKTRNLLVEVTATSSKVAEDVLAIMAIALHDAGFDIGSVTIKSKGKKLITPNMKPSFVSTDLRYINSILGMDLDGKQIVKCLQKSRLGAAVRGSKIRCEIPRHRTDISDSIDLVEEVALGYGIYNLEPTLPASQSAGAKSSKSGYFDAIRETLVGLGMLESLNFSLTSADIQYSSFDIPSGHALRVDSPKSAEHEILRESIIPSLLQSLSRNVHEEYPQRLFEIGKAFHGGQSLIEDWMLAAVSAHWDSGFTEIKSYMQALLRSGFGKTVTTQAAPSPFFISGRSASILSDGEVIGSIGEILPQALENLRLRVPVSAFEINLDKLFATKKEK
jgi:phenylalanyl-tRNA synthetase beta chain